MVTPSPLVFYLTEWYKCQHILQPGRPFSEHQLRGGLHVEINSRNPNCAFQSVLQLWRACSQKHRIQVWHGRANTQADFTRKTWIQDQSQKQSTLKHQSILHGNIQQRLSRDSLLKALGKMTNSLQVLVLSSWQDHCLLTIWSFYAIQNKRHFKQKTTSLFEPDFQNTVVNVWHPNSCF